MLYQTTTGKAVECLQALSSVAVTDQQALVLCVGVVCLTALAIVIILTVMR